MDSNSNSDWNVVGTEVLPRSSESSSRPSTSPTEIQNAFVGLEHGVNISVHERSYIQCTYINLIS